MSSSGSVSLQAPKSPWQPPFTTTNLMNTSEAVWPDIVKVFVERQSSQDLASIKAKYGFLEGLLNAKQFHIRRVDSQDYPKRPGYFLREVATPKRPNPNLIDFWICGDVSSQSMKTPPANGFGVVKLSKEKPLLVGWEPYPSRSKCHISPFDDKQAVGSRTTVWELAPFSNKYTSILIRGISQLALQTLNARYKFLTQGSDKTVTIEMMILDRDTLRIQQLTVD